MVNLIKLNFEALPSHSQVHFINGTTKDCCLIPGYVFTNNNRAYSSGGGVGLYIKSDRNFHLRDDLRIDTIENVWIETQDLIIGVIYKSAQFI